MKLKVLIVAMLAALPAHAGTAPCEVHYLAMSHDGERWTYQEPPYSSTRADLSDDTYRFDGYAEVWEKSAKDPRYTSEILADLARFERVPPVWREQLAAASEDPELRTAIQHPLQLDDGEWYTGYKVLVSVPEADPDAGLPPDSLTGFFYVQTSEGIHHPAFLFAPGNCNN